MTGWHSHWRFHVVNFWAHFWMAVAAWAVPLLFTKVWPRLRVGRIGFVAAVFAVWLTPYAFAFGHAATWQADRQREIERRAFDAVDLTLSGPVRGRADGYDVQLELGPRHYASFARATRLVEVEVLDIDARLTGDGTSVAFCRPLTRMLPSPRTERVPARYDAAVKRLDTTAILLRCARTPSGTVPADAVVEWAAQLRLRGEREARVVSLAGRQHTALAVTATMAEGTE